MKKATLVKITTDVDKLIILVRDAMHADDMPAWRGEEIINGLLDARHAATELRPVKVGAA